MTLHYALRLLAYDEMVLQCASGVLLYGEPLFVELGVIE